MDLFSIKIYFYGIKKVQKQEYFDDLQIFSYLNFIYYIYFYTFDTIKN